MKLMRLPLLLVMALALMLVQCKGEEGKKGATKAEDKAAAKAPVEEKSVEKAEEKAAGEEEGEETEEGEEGKDNPPKEVDAGGTVAAPANVAEAPAAGEVEDPELTDTVVARVNDKAVDVAEYVERLKKLTNGKVTQSMIKKTVVDRMINDELLRQETETLKVTVSDEEIAEAMNMDMERYTAQKSAMEARIKAFEERVSVRKVLEARGLLKEPTEEELKAEFERRFGLKLDAVTLPASPEATPEEKAQLEQEAQKIMAEVKAGATLRAVVKERKTPNGRRIIVKPMFIKRGDERHLALWEAANPLQEKDLGGPVLTDAGYVVFQLAKRIEPRDNFDEMKDKLAKSALNMKTAQAKHKLLETLRQDARIEYLIDFKKQADIPRLHGMGGGELAPAMRAVGPDLLRKSGPAAGMRAPMGQPEAAPAAQPEAAPAAQPAAAPAAQPAAAPAAQPAAAPAAQPGAAPGP